MENSNVTCPTCHSIAYHAKRRFFNYCKGCRYGKCKYAEYTELYVYICKSCGHCFEKNEIKVG